MRATLAGLTTRGRCFLAAGLTAVALAVLLGQRDVLRVGVLVASLPLVSALVVARTRYRLACSRRLEPARTPAGAPARVTVELENVSRLPTGVLLVEDSVPYVLGSRPRFVLDRVESRGRRQVSYTVRSDQRGRYVLGPLAIRLTDPLGMVELERSFTATDSLVVTPPVQSLPAVHLRGAWTGTGDSQARSLAAAGEDDVATREYRHGDPLHRVHWRSTARYGELMVRREEQPWQSRCTLLLDARRDAHVGDGPGSSFEAAVSTAASLGVHLARRGYAVRLLTDDGRAVTSAAHEPGAGVGDFEGLLLDALAVVGPTNDRSLRGAARALRRGGGDGLLVAVLGSMDTEEAAELARLRHASTSGIAVVLDTATWANRRGRAPRSTAAATAALLRRAGWRVLPVSAAAPVAEVWPLAARGLPGDDEPTVPGSRPVTDPALATSARVAGPR